MYPDDLQNSVDVMLNIDEFLDEVDTEEDRPAKFQEDNAINTLKEMAEHGRCSIHEYDLSDEMVELNDGRMMWKCTCYVRIWRIEKTAYATSKRLAKKYAAYLVLCDYFNLEDEYDN